MKKTNLYVCVTALLSILLSTFSFAAQESQQDENGVTLKGYDTVSYFTENKAVLGTADISAVYDGAIYRFSSEANRDLFKANPAKYAPQYGGYCAYGAAISRKFPIDPTVFAIVDGKLYVNANADVAKTWNKKQSSFITDANKAWPEIRTVAVAEL